MDEKKKIFRIKNIEDNTKKQLKTESIKILNPNMNQINFIQDKKLVNNVKENGLNNKVLVATSIDKSKENEFSYGINSKRKNISIEIENSPLTIFPQSTKNSNDLTKKISKNLFSSKNNQVNINNGQNSNKFSYFYENNEKNQLNNKDCKDTKEKVINFQIFNTNPHIHIQESRKFPQSTKNSISIKKLYNNPINPVNLIRKVIHKRNDKWGKESSSEFNKIIINEILQSKLLTQSNKNVKDDNNTNIQNTKFLNLVIGYNNYNLINMVPEINISVNPIFLIYYNIQFSVNFIFSLNFSKKNFNINNDVYGIFKIPFKTVFYKGIIFKTLIDKILKSIYDRYVNDGNYSKFSNYFYLNTCLFLLNTYIKKESIDPQSKYLNIKGGNCENNRESYKESISLLAGNIITDTYTYQEDKRNNRFTSTDTNMFIQNNNISNINTMSFVNNGNNDSICELIYELDYNKRYTANDNYIFNKKIYEKQLTKDAIEANVFNNNFDKYSGIKNENKIKNEVHLDEKTNLFYFENNKNSKNNIDITNKDKRNNLLLNRPYSVQQNQMISPKKVAFVNKKEFEIQNETLYLQPKNDNEVDNNNQNQNENQYQHYIKSKKLEKSKSNKSFKNNISDNMNRPNFLQSSIQCENQKVKSNFNTISNTNDKIKKVFVKKKDGIVKEKKNLKKTFIIHKSGDLNIQDDSFVYDSENENYENDMLESYNVKEEKINIQNNEKYCLDQNQKRYNLNNQNQKKYNDEGLDIKDENIHVNNLENNKFKKDVGEVLDNDKLSIKKTISLQNFKNTKMIISESSFCPYKMQKSINTINVEKYGSSNNNKGIEDYNNRKHSEKINIKEDHFIESYKKSNINSFKTEIASSKSNMNIKNSEKYNNVSYKQELYSSNINNNYKNQKNKVFQNVIKRNVESKLESRESSNTKNDKNDRNVYSCMDNVKNYNPYNCNNQVASNNNSNNLHIGKILNINGSNNIVINNFSNHNPMIRFSTPSQKIEIFLSEEFTNVHKDNNVKKTIDVDVNHNISSNKTCKNNSNSINKEKNNLITKSYTINKILSSHNIHFKNSNKDLLNNEVSQSTKCNKISTGAVKEVKTDNKVHLYKQNIRMSKNSRNSQVNIEEIMIFNNNGSSTINSEIVNIVKNKTYQIEGKSNLMFGKKAKFVSAINDESSSNNNYSTTKINNNSNLISKTIMTNTYDNSSNIINEKDKFKAKNIQDTINKHNLSRNNDTNSKISNFNTEYKKHVNKMLGNNLFNKCSNITNTIDSISKKYLHFSKRPVCSTPPLTNLIENKLTKKTQLINNDIKEHMSVNFEIEEKEKVTLQNIKNSSSKVLNSNAKYEVEKKKNLYESDKKTSNISNNNLINSNYKLNLNYSDKKNISKNKFVNLSKSNLSNNTMNLNLNGNGKGKGNLNVNINGNGNIPYGNSFKKHS